MGRLTVRLPDTLHQQLNNIADSEGVSLNQYIVYALTRQTTLAYRVHRISDEEIRQQRQEFESLLEELGEASTVEIEGLLADREVVEPETEIEKTAIARLQRRIAEQKS
jgi:hypothetical protein